MILRITLDYSKWISYTLDDLHRDCGEISKLQPSSRDHNGGVVYVMEERSSDLLTETMAFWQPRSSCQLSHEDARQAIENVTGFFSVLEQWERRRSAAKQKQNEQKGAAA